MSIEAIKDIEIFISCFACYFIVYTLYTRTYLYWCIHSLPFFQYFIGCLMFAEITKRLRLLLKII